MSSGAGMAAKHDGASRSLKKGIQPFGFVAGKVLHGLPQLAHHGAQGQKHRHRGDRL